MEFHLFLPQMRMTMDRMCEIARVAEAAGFSGIAGMDHLVPPLAHDQPMFEAMVTNTWLAAHTSTIRVGSLVLCDAMRHPAMLAREAVTIDHASGGRFELGLGWGSYQPEFDAFALAPSQPRERVRRMRETLQILTGLWSGETISYSGEFFQLSDVRFAPPPLAKIPILIGGSGPKTMELVREFADWWNLDVRHLDKFEGEAFQELKSRAGKARVSIQEMVALVPDGGDRQAITEVAMRRFGHSQPVVGSGPELFDHFSRRAEQGVKRSYVWFCDFGNPETLEAFGEQVAQPLAG